jgi:Ca2+-binding RTX toxin-like protein
MPAFQVFDPAIYPLFLLRTPAELAARFDQANGFVTMQVTSDGVVFTGAPGSGWNGLTFRFGGSFTPGSGTWPDGDVREITVTAPDGHVLFTAVGPFSPALSLQTTLTDPERLLDGNDGLIGSEDQDLLDGFTGDDRIEGRGGDDYLFGGGGADELFGGDGRDVLVGDSGDDRLNGEAGGDFFLGGAGDDIISGGDGADHVWGGSGANRLSGGHGLDHLRFDDLASSVVVSLADGVAVIAGLSSQVNGFERVVGSDLDDQITGDAYANVLFGAAGADQLVGAEGDDVIWGGPGADELQGGLGVDLLLGGSGDDRIEGGEHADSLAGGVGADRLDGGAGFDTVYYSTSWGSIVIDLENGSLNTGEAAGDAFISIEEFVGTVFDDALRGGSGSDIFHGDDGSDLLMGRAGDDLLLGGSGADSLQGGAGADYLDGGAGFDTVYFLDASTGLVLDLQNAALNTTDAAGDVYVGVEEFVGSSFDDVLRGARAATPCTAGPARTPWWAAPATTS